MKNFMCGPPQIRAKNYERRVRNRKGGWRLKAERETGKGAMDKG
jgi:hypothetical protein